MECCGKDLEFVLQEGEVWQSYRPEVATCGICGASYQRKRNSEIAYKAETEEGKKYVCTVCGTTIMAAKISHAIHDGPFPLSGSGKVQYEIEPYCPNCEEEPKPNGMPISVESWF